MSNACKALIQCLEWYLRLLAVTSIIIVYFKWYLTFLIRKNPTISNWFLIAPPWNLWDVSCFPVCFPEYTSFIHSTMIIYCTLAMGQTSFQASERPRNYTRLLLARFYTWCGRETVNKHKEINKIILESKCSKETKKVNELECDRGWGALRR